MKIGVTSHTSAAKVLSLLFILLPFLSWGQFYSGSYNEFGKNRVQYDDFRVWRYYRFQKFDTYFYEEGKALAIYASSYAYEQLKVLEKKLDFQLDTKVRMIVFKDLSDLKETNIGHITDVNYNIGGVTHIVDNKMFIYFNGDHNDFNRQIRHGLAQLLLEQMLNGTTIGSSMKNSYLMEFPEWYKNGLIAFLADEWTTELDLIVRDGILSGSYKRTDLLSAKEQMQVGHSIWKFIYDKYGPETLTEIVYMAKINRNIESGFLYVIGQTYNGLLDEWYKYFLKHYSNANVAEYQAYSDSFLKKNKSKRVYQNIRVSSDGQFAVHTQNEIGKVKVIVTNLTTGKQKTIKRFGNKLDEKVDYSYPLMAWAPTANYLALVYEEKGKNVIEFYDPETKEWRQKRYLMQLDKVLSIQYNKRGNQLVMSAIIKGQSDIFLYYIGANSFKRITYDIYDDHYPTFVNNDEAIIFSSNRINDTLKADVATNKHFKQDTIKGAPNRDLFFYDLAKSGNVLRRVTETPLADETHPFGIRPNQFCWISDESGIRNRYVGRFDSTISYVDTTTHYKYYTQYNQVSNYRDHIQEQNINPQAAKLTEVVYTQGHYKMYIKDLASSLEKVEEPYETLYKAEQLEKARKKLEQQLKPAKKDTSANEEHIEKPKKESKNKRFRVVQIGSMENNDEADQRKKTKVSSPKSLQKEKEEKVSDITADPNYNPFKASNYEVQFEINQLVSQVDFNYMNYSYQPYTYNSGPIYMNRGFTAFMKVGVMDLLEDKRIIGGVNLSTNLRNNEYFATYTDLTKRLDKEFTLHRVLYETNNYYVNYRSAVHEGFYKLSWPFNNVFSLRTTFNLRNEYTTLLAEDKNTMEASDYNELKVGAKVELVFDNTRDLALNLRSGSRWKIFAEYLQPVGALYESDYENLIEHNTFVTGFDFRRYFKLHKNLIWANRLAGSTSLGSDRLIYYMGGVDNWIFPKFNQGIQVDPDQNFIYQTLATNMRGFKQNIRNGNNFAVLNTELRWPLFSFFSKKPIKNTFLNNFLLVGFADVGTAWTGWNPFAEENALYRYTINQPPITVNIINQNDPIVAGFGWGTRFSLFGYYIRMDWAWGVQNGYVGDRMFYLSLDLDF